MRLIQSFNPSLNIEGDIITNGVNRHEQLVLYNASIYGIKLTFPDKTQDIIPPNWAKSWKKDSPMGNVHYQGQFDLGLVGQTLSLVFGVLYESTEYTADVNAPMQYSVNVGNPGGIVVNTPEQVLSDNSAAGTVYVSSYVQTEFPVLSSKLTNDGQLTLGSDNHSGKLTIESLANGIVQIAGTIKSKPNDGWSISSDGLLILGGVTYPGQISLVGGINALLSCQGALETDTFMLINQAQKQANGPTAGTVTWWQPMQGSALKIMKMTFSGYRNAGADQDIAIDAPFTNRALVYIGVVTNPINGVGTGLNFVSSGGTVRNIDTYTGDNTNTTRTQGKSNSIGVIQGSFDKVRILGSANNTGNATGEVLIVGN